MVAHLHGRTAVSVPWVSHPAVREALQASYLACIYDDVERAVFRCQECLREWDKTAISIHTEGCPMILAEEALGITKDTVT